MNKRIKKKLIKRLNHKKYSTYRIENIFNWVHTVMPYGTSCCILVNNNTNNKRVMLRLSNGMRGIYVLCFYNGKIIKIESPVLTGGYIKWEV